MSFLGLLDSFGIVGTQNPPRSMSSSPLNAAVVPTPDVVVRILFDLVRDFLTSAERKDIRTLSQGANDAIVYPTTVKSPVYWWRYNFGQEDFPLSQTQNGNLVETVV